MSSDPWFRLREATFNWGERSILREVDISLPEPRLAWLSGPSGSGKTTFLRIGAGHYRLAAGSCEILGATVDGPGADRSFVFQDFKLFPWKRVVDNVAAGLRFLRMDEREARDRAATLLDQAGLYPFRNDWPHQLSGGMQQRVAILRSLAIEPRCLLVDEPFSALDEDTARRMWSLIERYLSDSGAGCLVSSHNPGHFRRGNGHVLLFPGDGTVELTDAAAARRAGFAA